MSMVKANIVQMRNGGKEAVENLPLVQLLLVGVGFDDYIVRLGFISRLDKLDLQVYRKGLPLYGEIRLRNLIARRFNHKMLMTFDSSQ